MPNKRLSLILIALIATLLWGQTTIDFDDSSKWIGAGSLASYSSEHSYTDGVFSATGGPALRETSGTQDGFPKTFGNYAWRLRDNASVDWVITIASGGVSTFSLKIRRWDGSPSPNYNLEYSVDGESWHLVALINNASLDNSSDWKLFEGVIDSNMNNIRIRLKANGNTERIMVDDFTWTEYQSPTEPELLVIPPQLSGFTYFWGMGASDAQAFNLSGEHLNAAVQVSAPTSYEISLQPNSGFGNSLSLSPVAQLLAPTSIYVRLKANLSIGNYDETISINSGSITEQVMLFGAVLTPAVPAAPLALEATEITPNSFKANWLAVPGATNYRLDLYTLSSSNAANDLFFSEYIEGTSNNKALEIFNGTGATVNLGDYRVQLFNNGNSNVNSQLSLSGLLPDGEVYVLAHSAANQSITGVADYTQNGGVLGYNGDDAIALYKVSTDAYVDIFGVIGEQPAGGAWIAGNISTKDQTLVRKAEVSSGITVNPATFSTLGTEWLSFPVDTANYLGFHTFGSRGIHYVQQNLSVGAGTSYILSNLQPDTEYYYVVRAENAFGASDNSNIISVFTANLYTPTLPASHIEASIGTNSINLEWTPGNGARRVVIMNTSNYFSAPADGTDPTPNSSYQGYGQQVIYNGATEYSEGLPYNGVFVDNLQPETTYHFRIFEANGNGAESLYLSNTATGNPAFFTTLPEQFTGYYSGISGYGTALKADLHELIRTTHTTEYSYDALWTQLRYTDEDPDNSNNIIEIYTGWSVPKTHYGGGTTQWNREHTWSKSHGGFGESRPAGTDLHHLRPCDATVNSAKGNKDFDEGGTLYIDGSPYGSYSGNTGNFSSTYSWEPRDEDKGDVARMLMYMAVRYEATDTSFDLELVDSVNTSPTGQPYYGKLSTLLQWHNSDPVDARERQRNDRIYERQGNRNPFIDHPEFAQYLWTPVPLEASNISQSSFVANWSLPITGTAYYLQVSADSLFSGFLPGYDNYNAGTASFKMISGLNAGTTYYYRLRNFLGSGYSMYSPLGRVYIPSPEPVATTALISRYDNNISLLITPVSGAISYKIYAADEPGGVYTEITAQGIFSTNHTWLCPVGELPRRFYKVMAIR